MTLCLLYLTCIQVLRVSSVVKMANVAVNQEWPVTSVTDVQRTSTTSETMAAGMWLK